MSGSRGSRDSSARRHRLEAKIKPVATSSVYVGIEYAVELAGYDTPNAIKAQIRRQIEAMNKEAEIATSLRAEYLADGFTYTAANNLALLRAEAEVKPFKGMALTFKANKLEAEYRELRIEAQKKAKVERDRLLNQGMLVEHVDDIVGLYEKLYAIPDGALHASDDKQMTYLDATMDEGVTRQRRRELEAKIEAAESRAMEQVKAEHTRVAPKYKEPLR